MEQQHSLEEQITRLLAQIATATSSQEHVTAAETITTTGSSEDVHRRRRVVNVYIDLQEDEQQTGSGENGEDAPADQPIIESTLDLVDEPSDVPEVVTVPRTMPPRMSTTPLPYHRQRRTGKKRVSLVPIVVLTLCLLVIGAGTTLSVLVLLAPTATITIVPVSHTITTTSTIQVVPGPANPVAQQLIGRVLSSVTMNQAHRVPTTGIAHQEARAGVGRITFYNAAPYPQTIPAGTLLTGRDGVEVVTDADVVIPAVAYPTLGQATVSAHATSTGPLSNIGAQDIYGPCCRLNISAVSSAFWGGQDARSYQTVSQEDMLAVTSSLNVSLNTSVQAALQAQVHSDETLITPLPCHEHTQADYQVGEEATQLEVTMSESCTGEVYDTQAYHELATQVVSQAATKQLGEGYMRVGNVQATTTSTTTMHKNRELDLSVKVAGTWAYQFTQAEREQIKALLAGKSKDQAITTLLQVPGVASASVSIERGDTLPSETTHIQVAVVQMIL